MPIPPRIPQRAKPVSKVGMTKLGDRAKAQVAPPSTEVGKGDNRTQIYTYFTKPTGQSEQLYSGDRMWARVTLTLETAGPVAVGNMSAISPVLSGKGALLETGEPTPFDIARGTKLYIAADALNRVKVVIQPLPWMEQITAYVMSIAGRLLGK